MSVGLNLDANLNGFFGSWSNLIIHNNGFNCHSLPHTISLLLFLPTLDYDASEKGLMVKGYTGDCQFCLFWCFYCWISVTVYCHFSALVWVQILRTFFWFYLVLEFFCFLFPIIFPARIPKMLNANNLLGLLFLLGFFVQTQQKAEGHNKMYVFTLQLSLSVFLFLQLHRRPSWPGEYNRSWTR